MGGGYAIHKLINSASDVHTGVVKNQPAIKTDTSSEKTLVAADARALKSNNTFEVEFEDLQKQGIGWGKVPVRFKGKLPDGQLFVKNGNIELITNANEVARHLGKNDEANIIVPQNHPLVQAIEDKKVYADIPGYDLKLISQFEPKNGFVMIKVMRNDGIPTLYHDWQFVNAKNSIIDFNESNIAFLNKPKISASESLAISQKIQSGDDLSFGLQVLLPRTGGDYSYGIVYGLSPSGYVKVVFKEGNDTLIKDLRFDELKKITPSPSQSINRKISIAGINFTGASMKNFKKDDVLVGIGEVANFEKFSKFEKMADLDRIVEIKTDQKEIFVLIHKDNKVIMPQVKEALAQGEDVTKVPITYVRNDINRRIVDYKIAGINDDFIIFRGVPRK